VILSNLSHLVYITILDEIKGVILSRLACTNSLHCNQVGLAPIPISKEYIITSACQAFWRYWSIYRSKLKFCFVLIAIDFCLYCIFILKAFRVWCHVPEILKDVNLSSITRYRELYYYHSDKASTREQVADKNLITKATVESLYLLNVNSIYKVEHFRWRYVHSRDILGIPML
jgi:hypothetical protein